MDHDYDALKCRKILLKNNAWNFKKFSQNVTIMDLASQYTSKIEILKSLNLCRLSKKIIYPFELISIGKRKRTSSYLNKEETSQIKWDFEFPQVMKPSGKSWKYWETFLRWLEKQNVT